MKRKILLDLDSGAPSARCLELLAKRLLSERFVQTKSTAVGKNPVERALTLKNLSRFQEEPARVAPGNTARFWKTLFGEVKA